MENLENSKLINFLQQIYDLSTIDIDSNLIDKDDVFIIIKSVNSNEKFIIKINCRYNYKSKINSIIISKINERCTNFNVINLELLCFLKHKNGTCGVFIAIISPLFNFNKSCSINIHKNEFGNSIINKINDIVDEKLKILNQYNCITFQNEEVSTNNKYRYRYWFHNFIIKKFILTNKRKNKEKFTAKIEHLINGAKSVIDISCGDDEFIFKL